eukprot:712323-Pleurochrysis_carterae.AAC.1
MLPLPEQYDTMSGAARPGEAPARKRAHILEHLVLTPPSADSHFREWLTPFRRAAQTAVQREPLRILRGAPPPPPTP